MKHLAMPRDNRWEDDAVYTFDGAWCEVWPQDTVLADDLRYYIRGHNDPLPTAFFLKGRRNVVLDFGGATVRLHGKLQPFLLDGCENVTIRNVSILYDRSPYTQGEVVSADDRRLILRIGEAFPYRAEDGELIITGPGWENRDLDKAPMFLQCFDTQTRQGTGIHLAIFGKNPRIDPALPWANATLRFTAEEENGLLVLERAGGPALPGFAAGQTVIIGHESRNRSGIQMVCCKDVRLQSFRILNGRGMGVFPFHCENLYMEGLRMTFDEHSPGFAANAADGVHAFGCLGDFVLRDSVIEGTIDDALNVHSNFYEVRGAEGNRITAFVGLEPNAETPLFLPGDRIAVHRGHTVETAAEYTLAAVKPVGEKTVEFTVDSKVQPHGRGDAVENLSTQCRLTLSGCRFGKANTHLRFQTRGGVRIERCETELPFLLTGDMTYWFESSPCERFVVRDTVFSHPRANVRVTPEFEPTGDAPYYHGDLRLEGCAFATDRPVDAAYVRSISMTGCTNSEGLPMRARLLNCGPAQIEGCEVQRETETKHTPRVN